MNAETASLIVAIIAAAASIAAVAYTQLMSFRLEREKWERSQIDQRHKAVTDAIVAYGRDLSAALQRADVLTWTAKNDPEAITELTLTDYDKAAQLALITLSANRLTLIAQDSKLAARLDPAALTYYKIDVAIATATALCRRDRKQGIDRLAECEEMVYGAWEKAFEDFRAVLEGIPSSVAFPALKR